MKKVSIKTVDGSRNEYTVKDDDEFDIEKFAYFFESAEYISFPIQDGVKYINKENIVSITVTEI